MRLPRWLVFRWPFGLGTHGAPPTVPKPGCVHVSAVPTADIDVAAAPVALLVVTVGSC